jgi:hypothetical protein
MAGGARRPANLRELPDGYRTPRVRRALDDLSDQIKELRRLVTPVQRELPPAEINGGRLMVLPPALGVPVSTLSAVQRPARLIVANIGNGAVTGLKIQLSSDSTGFQLGESSYPAALQPSGTLTVTVFNTGTPGQTGKVLINGDNQDQITVPLTAEVAGAAVNTL